MFASEPAPIGEESEGDSIAAVRDVWRALLPGAAQLWFRCYYTWLELWPFKLLQLVRDDVSLFHKYDTANALFASEICCRDGGLTDTIFKLALSHFETREQRVSFVLSQYVISIIRSWAANLIISITEIECFNAQVKHFTVSGRPEDFSMTSAKGLLRNAVAEFRQQHGRMPQDRFNASVNVVQETLQGMGGTEGATSSRKSGPQRGKRNAYNCFTREMVRQHKALHVIPNPKQFFSLQRGRLKWGDSGVHSPGKMLSGIGIWQREQMAHRARQVHVCKHAAITTARLHLPLPKLFSPALLRPGQVLF